MDPARLAADVTTLLAGHLANSGALPAALQPLWQTLQTRFAGRPAAESAAADLQRNAGDADNQQAFEVQLRKLLKEDADLVLQLAALLGSAPAPRPAPSGPSISIGGGVGGHVVVGSGNTVSSSVHTERHGGVDVNAGGDVNVGGDVVGQDKTTSQQ